MNFPKEKTNRGTLEKESREIFTVEEGSWVQGVSKNRSKTSEAQVRNKSLYKYIFVKPLVL